MNNVIQMPPRLIGPSRTELGKLLVAELRQRGVKARLTFEERWHGERADVLIGTVVVHVHMRWTNDWRSRESNREPRRYSVSVEGFSGSPWRDPVRTKNFRLRKSRTFSVPGIVDHVTLVADARAEFERDRVEIQVRRDSAQVIIERLVKKHGEWSAAYFLAHGGGFNISTAVLSEEQADDLLAVIGKWRRD